MEREEVRSVITRNADGAMSHVGTLALCRTCCHWLAGHWRQGHPSPCARVRWDGPHHLKPALTITVAGGIVCDEFKPLVVETIMPVVVECGEFTPLIPGEVTP